MVGEIRRWTIMPVEMCVCCLVLLIIGRYAAAEAGPNVVVIFVDDMGYADPGCFGNPIMKTPHIDRLASEGTKFTNFYVNSPICSASRVALTTGQYQQRYRIHSFFAGSKSNRQRKMPNWLDPAAPTLAKTLKSNGYHTAHFGKWHMGGGRDVDNAPLPQEYGFDESLVSFEGLGDRILFHKKNESWNHGRGTVEGVEKYETSPRYADRVIDFMERHREEAFYVRFFPNDVHDAHIPSEEQLGRWAAMGSNEYERKFFAVLEALDQQIGRILDALDELKLAENTLVIFTSDNGPTDWPHYYRKNIQPPGFTGPLFGRKWSLYEGGIRMPFIVRWPGRIPAGESNDTSVLVAMDMHPTIAKLTDSGLPDQELDGLDMSRVLLGADDRRPQPVFWEYGIHGSIRPGKKEHRGPKLAMRDGKWKLLCDPDSTNTKLFDLEQDIGERHNLASAQPAIVSKLRPQLLSWWSTMNAYYPSSE